jgi:putative membrane protein
VTNILISFGMLLALHPGSFPRLLHMVAKVRPWSRTLLILWAVSMVPTPLAPDRFTFLAQLSTVLLALGVLAYTVEAFGHRALLLFSVSLAFGFGIEWFGSTTGFPFGAYQYNATVPSLMGIPILVPLGWWAFTMIAIAAAPKRGGVWLASLALVVWDLGLDPLMVHMGFWTFERPGAYGEIPFTNFLGWYAAGVLLIYALLRLEPRLSGHDRYALRMVFVVQAGLMTIGLFYFGLIVPGFVTALGMSAFMLSWKLFPTPVLD